MAWNYNAASTDDFLNNYRHELDKYKSEFRKIKTEIEKDDSITVNNLISVEPGVKEIKRNRKKFASGGSLSVVSIIHNTTHSPLANIPCYSVNLPITFNPTTIAITFRIQGYDTYGGKNIFTVFQNKESDRYQVGYRGSTLHDSDTIWNVTYTKGGFTDTVNNIPDTARNKSNNNQISSTFNSKSPIFYIDNKERYGSGNPPEIMSWFATE